ncbi:MAG: hypothetical protein HY741_07605 [Chloroflexi bacterium]|nr:hypothetical protein [Chloroflexota bacterium]
MQLRIAAIADYVNITGNGKLNIMGIFSQIRATAVPVIHPQMQVVFQIAFEPSEAGQRHVRISLHDLDGTEVIEISGTMEIPNFDGPDPLVVNQLLPLMNVVFPHFGSYEFTIEIDGTELPAHIPVDLIQIANADQSQV